MKQTLSAALLICFCLFSCTNNKKGKEQEMTEKTNNTSTLAEELNARKSSFNAKAPEQLKKEYEEGIISVEEQSVTSHALQVGDKAIDFTLRNASGKEVNLYKELEKGPIILMWYRGGWCPYCNITLHYMQEALPQFRSLGANLLALTPELPDNTLTTKEKNSLDFQVLSDLNNKVGLEYKVVFKLTDAVAKSYEDNFKLSEYNGNHDNELPLAATYVIDRDGTITYAFLDADYRNRAEPADIIEALKKIQ